MNFSPDNRMTLEALLAGLSSGVSGEQAAPILAATLQAQAAQTADRKARYQQMASDVTDLAGQGMTYGATENYVDAMTQRAGVPGRFQELIDSAFANPDIPEQFQDELGPQGRGYQMQPGGGFAMEGPGPIPPAIQAQLQSPLYTQNPASTGAYNMNPGPNQGNLMPASGQARYAAMGELLASQGAPAEPSSADQMGQVNSQINAMKAAQMTPEEIVQRIATAPDVQGIIMDNLSEFAQIQPDIIQLMTGQ